MSTYAYLCARAWEWTKWWLGALVVFLFFLPLSFFLTVINNNRDRDCVSAFFTALSNVWMEPTLREVVFDSCKLPLSNTTIAFCAALESFILENVEELGLVAMPDCFNWTPTLESMCLLKKLDISHSDIPLANFLSVLFAAPSVDLEGICLNGHQLTAPCIRLLLESRWPESVREVSLADCNLNGAHVPLLLYLFSKLQVISISKNPQLLGAPLAALCEANPLSLTSLSLSDMPLSKGDMISVLSLLDGKSVTALDLSRTHISKKGFDTLLRGLSSEGCSVLKLDLSHNMLHSLSNFHDLFCCLRYPSRLTHLSLAGCGLTKVDVQMLADFLVTDPPLEVLNLSDNALGTSLLILVRALKCNASLHTLEVRDRSINRYTWTEFFEETKLCLGLTVNTIADQQGTIFSTPLKPSVIVVSPATLDIHTSAPSVHLVRLHFLDLGSSDASKVSLQHPLVEGARNLSELGMQRCHAVDWSLPPLRTFRGLTVVSLQACSLRDGDLATLCSHAASFFPDLRSLFLDSNCLTALTPRIGDLKLLEYLSCRDNLLDDLPVQLAQLSALAMLDLRFNPLTALPFHPLMQSTASVQHLFTYLRESASSHAIPNPLMRLCVFAHDSSLVGGFVAALKASSPDAAAEVGSSRRATEKKKGISLSLEAPRRPSATRSSPGGGDHEYPRFSVAMSSGSPYIKSLGGSSSDMNGGAATLLSQFSVDFPEGTLLPKTPVSLVVWHGDALLRACPPQLLENCLNVVLFDGSPSRSESQMSKDILEVKNNVSGGKLVKKKFFAVGMVPKEESFPRSVESGLQDRLRRLTGSRAFFYTSSLLATLQECAKDALKGKMIGFSVPSSWVAIAKKVESNLSTVLTMDSFSLIAQGYSIIEVSSVLRYLVERGLVWWFEDQRELRNWVFLGPARVYALCLHLVTQLREPVLSLAQVDSHWSAFITVEVQPAFWRLLHVLNLLFELPESQSLVPAALPKMDVLAPLQQQQQQQQGGSSRRLRETGRVYSYGFMQEVFFPRVQSKLHFWRNVMVESVWQGGIRLTLSRNSLVERATLTWDAEKFELRVRVTASVGAGALFKATAPTEGNLLRLIVETIDAATRSCFCSEISISIPCTHCLADEAARADPFLFSYEQVVGALTTDSIFVLCHGLRNRRVLIASLAPDIALADIAAGRKTIPKREIEMKEELGRGGYARVCKGLYNGQVVAVKQINSCTSADEFAEFQREVWVMGGHNSPFLVRLHGVCMEPPMLVMEYVPEGTLYEFLQNKFCKHEELPPLLRIRIALDVARGMLVLSSSVPPLIHGDLKSPNVLLAATAADAPCVAKVADFGLTHHMSGINSSGRDVHNPDWLAPEVILNLPYTPAADVFSFAIILWELLALQHPFSEYDDRFRGFPQEMKEKAIALEGLRPTPPPAEDWYRALMVQAWDREPERRPSFDNIANALQSHFPLTIAQAGDDDDAMLMSADILTPETARIRSTTRAGTNKARAATQILNSVPTSNSSLLESLPSSSSEDMLSPERRGFLSSSGGREINSRGFVASSDAPHVVSLMRRMVLDSLPTAVAVAIESDWIYCGTENGTVLVASQRVGSILSQTDSLKHGSVSDVKMISKKVVLFSFQDGTILSFSPNLVPLDNTYVHPRGAACLWMQGTHLVQSPVVVAFADESLHLLSSAFVPIRSLSVPHVSAGIVEQVDGQIVMFLGDRKGEVHVYSVPEFTLRGKIQVTSKQITALVFDVKQSTLWVGDSAGLVSPCRYQESTMTLLAARQAHHSKIVSFVIYPRIRRLASRSLDGHLCWWTIDDMDLEFEATEFAFASDLPSFEASGSGAYGVCDHSTVSVCIYSISLNSESGLKLSQSQVALPPHMRRSQARHFSNMDMKSLLNGADARMALYVSIQQFRQTQDAGARRIMALRIKEDFFADSGPHSVTGLSFELKKTMRAKLIALSQNASAECPPEFFDSVAKFVIESQRSSLVDLTKTVFLDLCAKGLELRALSYDESIVLSFMNMCTNQDAAAWETISLSSKWKAKGVRFKGEGWTFRNLNAEDASGKSRTIIHCPASVVMDAVSQAEHKLQWEAELEASEEVESFGDDFCIVHQVYQIGKLLRKRDVVLGYLKVKRGDLLMLIARSVPFGTIPSPPNCERVDVDTSGFMIRSIDATSCEVTYLMQLREVRKRVAPVVFKRLREKRLAQIFLLKYYLETVQAPSNPALSSRPLSAVPATSSARQHELSLSAGSIAKLGHARAASGTPPRVRHAPGGGSPPPGQEEEGAVVPTDSPGPQARSPRSDAMVIPTAGRAAVSPPSESQKSPRSPRQLLSGFFTTNKK